jgi:periplasmic protein TonB
MFEDALMESTNKIRTKTKYWSFLAMLIDCALLIALIIWPLLHPEALPRQSMATLLVAPAPPPPPPQAPQPKLRVHSEALGSKIQAPNTIPRQIKLAQESAALPPSIGVIGMEGLTKGTPGGDMNALFSSVGQSSVVVKAQPKTLSISSGVMAGNLLDKTMPQYPAIAKAARIQGTVILQATIAKTGTIQNLRVMSGPQMLQQAAVDAVRSWRYKPYLLNGEPVEVETTVNVVFNLDN